MAENIVKFGLKNVHYALQEVGVDGKITYGTPVRFPGAVNLTLDTRGDTNDFYADDRIYYTSTANNGYNGTYEAAEIPQSFRVDVLGEVLGADNVLTEINTNQSKKIALMFEFNGDAKATRHVLYDVKMARPTTSGATTTDTIEPQTQELTFVAAPRIDGVVKRSTTAETEAGVYDAWYTAVYEPTTAPVETP